MYDSNPYTIIASQLQAEFSEEFLNKPGNCPIAVKQVEISLRISAALRRGDGIRTKAGAVTG